MQLIIVSNQNVEAGILEQRLRQSSDDVGRNIKACQLALAKEKVGGQLGNEVFGKNDLLQARAIEESILADTCDLVVRQIPVSK